MKIQNVIWFLMNRGLSKSFALLCGTGRSESYTRLGNASAHDARIPRISRAARVRHIRRSRVLRLFTRFRLHGRKLNVVFIASGFVVKHLQAFLRLLLLEHA